MYKRQDKVGVLKEASDVVDEWSFASLEGPRGDSAANLHQALLSIPNSYFKQGYNSVEAALDIILPNQPSNTLLIVFGSFFTVAGAIHYFKK